MSKASIDTQFGRLTVVEVEGAITALTWGEPESAAETPLLKEAVAELAAYDAGDLETFDLPMRVDGSAFQKSVSAAISAIPFGATCTYGEIAQDLGLSAQAVGRGCGGNPIPILIPCHRVVGVDGKLLGFLGCGWGRDQGGAS